MEYMGPVWRQNPRPEADDMPRNWFSRCGLFYLPRSGPGWLVTVAALAFCVRTFLAVDRRSHSVSDTLYGIVPFVVPALLLLHLVARSTSPRD